jgi:hypothetical protein
LEFYEKLDFLMNITKTSNSALGQRVKLDPSYISRIRRGKRNAIKDEAIIAIMSDYFTRHCTADYQRKSLSDTLQISMSDFDNGELSACIAKWLSSEKTDETEAVGAFPNGVFEMKTKSKISEDWLETINQKNDLTTHLQDEISVYYGIEGKRKASEYFLLDVIAQNRPQSLLLHSDEATDWMTTDSEYAAKWAKLMTGVLSKGNKIKIIHTVSRDLDEMLNAILQWMPLYMTGLIEPYYYPKKRDGIFKQTLFVSPGVSAVVSRSVGNSINHAANILIRNVDAIGAYTKEFNQYLSQCKPLMRIFAANDKESYLETLAAFDKEENNSMIKTESLSLLTMPINLVSKIMTRAEIKDSNLLEYQKQRIKIFEKHLQTNSFVEIISMSDLETVKNDEIKVSFSDIMGNDSIYYTREEYIQHLENLIHWLKTYNNFHVNFIEDTKKDDYMVYVKEDLGTIIAKTASPSIILAANESNLTAAFWGFLRDMISVKNYQKSSNTNTVDIKRLKEYIQIIKDA